MKQVLVLVGPTAVGKSDFGVRIAQEMNGEIISGDSIQVYRGFNIGSGKVTAQEMLGIPHHGIDILDSKEGYSVADFQTKARNWIDEIEERQHLPIVVGGTGLYIKACLYDYQFDEQSRDDIDESLLTLDNETLYSMLKELDAQACTTIHPNNRKRILRALTIAQNGKTKSEIENNQTHSMIYDALILGLTCQREHLYQRINQRVDKMFALGLEEEVETLLKNGVDFQDQAMQGIGYRQWQDYFNKNQPLDEVKQTIQTQSRQFAKRQYTWFNHQMPVQWIDIEEENWQEKALELIRQWRKKDE